MDKILKRTLSRRQDILRPHRLRKWIGALAIGVAICSYVGCSASRDRAYRRLPSSQMQVLKDGGGNQVDLSKAPFFSSLIGWRGTFGQSCSYTWITNEGHALTALHCIRSCIEVTTSNGGMKGLLKKIEVPNTLDMYKDPYVVYEVDEDKVKDVRCSDRNLKGLQVKIIALGARGWIPEDVHQSFSEKYPEVYKKYREMGYVGVGDIGDYALVQFERVQKAPLDLSRAKFFSYPPNCLRLNSNLVQVGEKVWNLSFPAFSRPDGSSAHYEPRVSGGLVFSKHNHPRYPPESLSGLLDAFLFASTDIEGGSSGSSLINSQGRIVGVVPIKTEGPNQYIMGTTAFVPTAIILSRLQKKLGADFVQKNILNGCKTSQETQQLLSLILQIKTEN